jgi:hypothetical protein
VRSQSSALKTLLFGSISLLGGIMLTFGEIRRFFTHTAQAVLENLWDWKRGRVFKLTLGLLLMYGGALAIYLHQTGDTLLLRSEFPYVLPSNTAADFLPGFALGAGLWILISLVTSATTEGDVFPAWVTRAFHTIVKVVLSVLWLLTGWWMWSHRGGDMSGDWIALAFWLVAAFEIKAGFAGGFHAIASSSGPDGDHEASFGTWWVLSLENRPVLYVMAVLVSLAFAALFCLAE